MATASPLTIDDFAKLPDEEYPFAANAHGRDVSFLGPDKAGNDTFANPVRKASRYRESGTKEAWSMDIEI
jgi:hypothetical protein